jgi:hypothetical protein
MSLHIYNSTTRKKATGKQGKKKKEHMNRKREREIFLDVACAEVGRWAERERIENTKEKNERHRVVGLTGRDDYRSFRSVALFRGRIKYNCSGIYLISLEQERKY